MRMCELALAEMTEAMGRGWANRDSRVVMTLAQERAGIDVKVDPLRLKEALARAFPAQPRS
jgi:3-hydroxyisobutyrate dehydrogenase